MVLTPEIVHVEDYTCCCLLIPTLSNNRYLVRIIPNNMLKMYTFLIETMQLLIKSIMKGVSLSIFESNWYYLHIIYIQISEDINKRTKF